MIPGRYGQITWSGGPELAVYCDRPRLFQRLWAIPGVRRHQTGDREMRALFPPDAIYDVGGLVRAQRRRQGRSLSPSEAKTLRRARVEATSDVQTPRLVAGTDNSSGGPAVP